MLLAENVWLHAHLHSAPQRVPGGAVGDATRELVRGVHPGVRRRICFGQMDEGLVVGAGRVVLLAVFRAVPRVIGHDCPLFHRTAVKISDQFCGTLGNGRLRSCQRSVDSLTGGRSTFLECLSGEWHFPTLRCCAVRGPLLSADCRT